MNSTMPRNRRYRFLLAFVFGASLALPAVRLAADVKLPAVISDNMVLQCAIDAPVWGWADAGEEVTVAIGGQTKTAVAGQDGKWMVRLDEMKTGGEPLTLTVSGKNTITVENVLVGEVWICSGQSNMGWTVSSSNDAEKEIAAADFPAIRLFTVKRHGTPQPQFDCQGEWVECSPRTVGNFSAVGYFFGRQLHQQLKLPVGLINTSWGGSACEAWVRRDVLEADPRYEKMLAHWTQRMADYDFEKIKADHKERLADWKVAAQKAKDEGQPEPRQPRGPRDASSGNGRPANLYNGMIQPLLPYAIRGAIWYQGESNASRAYQYRHLFPNMITNWRGDWGQGDFPFYFVQLANFLEVQPEPGNSSWAELREAQSMALSLPNMGQAVIIDIGEADDIHPRNKQDVGKRLSLWALAKDYGQPVVYSGPVYQSMKEEGGKIVLSFDHVGGGLVAKDGQPLKGFAIAGADQKFVWADAKIVGDTVVVSCPQVAQPVAVRYAWANNPICNLYNAEDLPASPFRTDDWPGVTVNN